MSTVQKFVIETNDRNVDDWRNYPLDRMVHGLHEEKGEISGVLKKNDRSKRGWRGSKIEDEDFIPKLKGEIAGTTIYCCLICEMLGIDLLEVVKEEVEVLKARFGWK